MKAFPIMPTFLMIPICILLIITILRSSRNTRYITMVVLLFLINQRLMIPSKNTQTQSNNIDILFIIDNTISMVAEDYNGHEKRLDGVKNDCAKIIKELNGAKFGIITFNNNAKVVIPFTVDSNMALESIEIIEPINGMYAKGTSLNAPLKDAERILKNSYKKDSNRIRVVFFISDGEITSNDNSLQSYSSLKKYIHNGAVLGYGTKTGGIMHYSDSFNKYNNQQNQVVMDNTSYPPKKAISKIDEKNLNQIAKDLNIDYIYMNKSNNINSKINEIKKEMKKEKTSSKISSYNDSYFILAIPLLILIVLEFKRLRGECS